MPQGREIFPLLSVRENLETGFAPLKRKDRTIPDDVFTLFPVLKTMLGRRGGDLSGGQQQQLAIGRALVMRPKLLVLDEPTEGIQPSIIKDIGRAIVYLKEKAGLAIVLVEQYLDFARELADSVAIMDRGEVVHSGTAADLDDAAVRRHPHGLTPRRPHGSRPAACSGRRARGPIAFSLRLMGATRLVAPAPIRCGQDPASERAGRKPAARRAHQHGRRADRRRPA